MYAENLPFEKEFFDATVMTDSYIFFDRNVRYLEEKHISFIKSKVWTDCLKQDKRICHRRQKINGSRRRKIFELYKDCFKKEISNERGSELPFLYFENKYNLYHLL